MRWAPEGVKGRLAAAGPWIFLRGQVPVLKSLRGVQDVKPTVTGGLQLEVL